MHTLYAIVERNTPGGDFRFFHVLALPFPYQKRLEKPVSLSITKAKPHLPYANFFCVPASGGHISLFCPTFTVYLSSRHAYIHNHNTVPRLYGDLLVLDHQFGTIIPLYHSKITDLKGVN